MQKHDGRDQVERDADCVRNREVCRGERRQEPSRSGQHQQDPEPALRSPPPCDHAGENEAENPPDRKPRVYTGLRDVVARQRQEHGARRSRQSGDDDRAKHRRAGRTRKACGRPTSRDAVQAPICLGIRPDECPSTRTARAATDRRSVADEDSRLRGIAHISCPRAALRHVRPGEHGVPRLEGSLSD